jgi:hypothetical protein
MEQTLPVAIWSVTKLIRRWDNASLSSYKDLITSADNTIQDIKPLPDGGIVFSGSHGFGTLNTKGKEVFFRHDAAADYRYLNNTFLLSSDGLTVQFSYKAVRYYYEKKGDSTARFNVSTYALDTNPRTGGEIELLPHITDAPSLSFSDWKASSSPKVNGKLIKLKYGGRSISRAMTPKGDSCQRSFQTEPFSVVKSEPLCLYDWSISAPSLPTFPRSL